MVQRGLLYLFLSALIAGCSQKIKDVGATLEQSIWGGKDIELSKERLQQLPYASLYARINQGHQIHMVLAYAEQLSDKDPMKLKWITEDRVLIVTEGGRITKTLAMPKDNLAELSTKSYPFGSETPTSWSVTYDWQPGYRYGYQAKIIRKLIGSETVDTPLKTFKTKHYIETVYFQSLKAGFDNHYWVDNQGRVVKTIQHIGPDMSRIELLLIRDFG